MNVQIVEEYYFVLYFIYLLNFFVFSFDFACVLEFVWLMAHGWVVVMQCQPSLW